MFLRILTVHVISAATSHHIMHGVRALSETIQKHIELVAVALTRRTLIEHSQMSSDPLSSLIFLPILHIFTKNKQNLTLRSYMTYISFTFSSHVGSILCIVLVKTKTKTLAALVYFHSL